jgi:CelD/BcsL family acetyltransferase involved in cellulose biosynthesis
MLSYMRRRVDERISGLTILELTDPRWADFVARQPSAIPFHHPDWGRLIADCYGFRAFAVTSSDTAGDIRAGLPVIEVRHLWGERKWVTLPFTDYCPPLIPAPDEGTDLVCALQRASKAAGIQRVEVRGPLTGTSTVSHAALRHVVALDADPDRVFARFHPAVRTHIRQAGRRGVTIRRAERPEDEDTFYRLHLRTRRRQGVPVQPRRFFRMLWESVISTGLGTALIAEASGEPVAADIFLTWNGMTIGKFSASDERAWPLRANNLVIWHSIKTACEQGSRWFDFGRSDIGNEGLRTFKLSWGAVEQPLVYETLGATPEPASARDTPARDTPARDTSEKASARDGIADHLLAAVIRRGPPVVCRVAGGALYRYAA